MKNKELMHDLYIELVKLQKEVIKSDLKLLVILEGRDAAGKDGTIKTILRHLSPREARVVALSKPSDRQGKEWYFQRYVDYLPASGEFVLFNRSWYNRLGVEKVMHFCTGKEYKAFFKQVEMFEEQLVDAGFIIFKYYLDISKNEQEKRLKERQTDPLKQWKVSPIDAEATRHWKDYSEARDEMLIKTSFQFAPWHIVNAEDKDAAHVGLISHLLRNCAYPHKNEEALSHGDGIVYPATPENIKDRLF
jgi:polyphosphate kinase 2